MDTFKAIINKTQATFKTVRKTVCRFFLEMKQTGRFRHNKEGKKIRSKKMEAWNLFWFPFLLVYYELILRLVTGTTFFNHILLPIFFGFAFGMILSVFVMLWKPKINRIVTIILSCICAFFFALESIVHNTFTTYMNLPAIFAGSKGVMNNYFGDMLLSVLGNFYILILLALPIIFYCLFGRKFIKPHRYKWPMAVAFVVASLFLFAVATLFASTGATKNKYKTQYNFDTATNTFGLTASIRLDAAYAGKDSTFDLDTDNQDVQDTEVAIEQETPAAEGTKTSGLNKMDIDFLALTTEDTGTLKDLDNYVASLTPSKKNEYTGLFEGKNLILICAEAFQDSFVSPEFTPTLYRLIHNGFYFSDFYQPAWGGSTITGEYSFTMGLAPLDYVESFLDLAENNNYFTMGNQLQRLGYYNVAFHSGEYDYYDRQLTHENIGYGDWLALGSGLEDITGPWPEDEPFFDYTMDTYMDKQPFSIYYMTISGHCTYDEENERVWVNYDEVNNYFWDKMETTKYYICYQLQLEKALTTMVDKLEKAGIADDTVICMVADHYPYGLAEGSFGNTEDYISDLYGYYVDNCFELDSNALIIWSGCLEHENKDMACEISTPTFSLDILPTLSNLFGLDYDSRLLVGRDVFSGADPLVFWPGYSWVTDKGYYDSDTDTFTPMEGVILEDEASYVNRITRQVSNRLSFSSNVAAMDYYGHLFGPDTDTSTNEELVGTHVANPKVSNDANDDAVLDDNDDNLDDDVLNDDALGNDTAVSDDEYSGDMFSDDEY